MLNLADGRPPNAVSKMLPSSSVSAMSSQNNRQSRWTLCSNGAKSPVKESADFVGMEENLDSDLIPALYGKNPGVVSLVSKKRNDRILPCCANLGETQKTQS